MSYSISFIQMRYIHYTYPFSFRSYRAASYYIYIANIQAFYAAVHLKNISFGVRCACGAYYWNWCKWRINFVIRNHACSCLKISISKRWKFIWITFSFSGKSVQILMRACVCMRICACSRGRMGDGFEVDAAPFTSFQFILIEMHILCNVLYEICSVDPN